MSKFNTSRKGCNLTSNRSGNKAYTMSEYEKLLTMVLTTFWNEEKYYGSTDSEIRTLVEKMCASDPEFVAKLCVYARKEYNLRSVSHFLVSIIADKAPAYTRLVLRNIIIRPDDILEIMSCYHELHLETAKRVKDKGCHSYAITPYPNALKRELALQIQKFSPESIAKYNGGSKGFKFSDVIKITHPKPKDSETSSMLKAILSDTLETPYTWETELSSKGNNSKTWNSLIESKKLGYMAMLRNLRNIIQSGADYKPVLKVLASPEQVKKSKQLPFRFLSAYRELESACILSKEVYTCLEKAIRASISNIKPIKGRTLIAVDESGSMRNPLSERSKISVYDVANLLGVLASHICEESTVVHFSYEGYGDRPGIRVVHHTPSESILGSVTSNPAFGGGTDLSLPFKYALNEKAVKPFDRIILLSDNETNSDPEHTIQPYAQKYRRNANPDFWVHAVDLQGYGTQQFIGCHTNILGGWSEKVLDFINLVEEGAESMVKYIKSISLE